MSKIPSQSLQQLWSASATQLNGQGLASDHKTEILIVGAGIAGLSCAYQLVRDGYDVTVIDAAEPGSGETANSSAHLTSICDDHFSELEKMFDEDQMQAYHASHAAAIDTIEAITLRENIECDFERVSGYLVAKNASDTEWLEGEWRAAVRAGCQNSQLLDNIPMNVSNMGPAIEFPNQAQIDPMAYIRGLADAFQKQGGRLYCRTEFLSLEQPEEDRLIVQTQTGYFIEADHVIMATNTPIQDQFAMHTKLYPYRSYVLALELDDPNFPKALIWDNEDPYHYVRRHDAGGGKHLLIVGGEDHKVGQDAHPEESYQRLEAWVREHIPAAGRVIRRWSGQILETADGLAYIGRNPGDERVYIVTGDSGEGLTHGTIASLILPDLIEGREHPWADLYAPDRINWHGRSLREYLTENGNVARQYLDYVRPGDVKSLDEIAPGEGAIVRQGFKKIAAYRDESDQLQCVSAVCPHLGGIVRWNGAEKTWDCPCHGSRFDTNGDVINGPSLKGLAPVNPPQKMPKDKFEAEHQATT